jgi:hypothetical protein
MSVKNYQLFIGLSLLLLQSTAMATNWADEYSDSTIVKNYSNCKVVLSDDDFVAVSFNFTLSDDMDNNPHHGPWQQQVGIQQPIAWDPNKALLRLYFYNADGSLNNGVKKSDIQDLLINGVSPQTTDNDLQVIEFTREPSFPNHSYSVSFRVAAGALNAIRLAATVGGTREYQDKFYAFISPKGVSFNKSGHQCADFDAVNLSAPTDTLQVDPKFRLASAVWQLKPIDLDKLLHKTANDGSGLHAKLNDKKSNRFCIHYRPMGVRNTRYMISAHNLNGLATNNQYFQLKDQESNKIINYQVKLKNHDNADVDFSLPIMKQFIRLDDNNENKEKMCWSPIIRVYSTETTDKGHYTDMLNFTITPSA